MVRAAGPLQLTRPRPISGRLNVTLGNSRSRKRRQPRRLARHFFQAKFQRPGEADDARHIERAAAQAAFVAAAGDLRLEPHRRRRAADVQSADAFRAVDLVGREAHQVDAQRVRRRPESCRRLAWRRSAAARRARGRSRRSRPAAGSRRSRCWPASPRPAACRRASASATCSGSSQPGPRAAGLLDGQQRDFEAAAAEPFERIEHGLVLGRDADQMIAAAAVPLGHAADRQVVALGGAAGEDDFARPGADGRGDRLPGPRRPRPWPPSRSCGSCCRRCRRSR